MQKLCLLKLVRPECLVAAIQQYVSTSLGPHFAEPGPVVLQSVKKDSNNTTPIIFILSPGGVSALGLLLIRCGSAASVVVVVAVMVVVAMMVEAWGPGCRDVSGGGGNRGGNCSNIGGGGIESVTCRTCRVVILLELTRLNGSCLMRGV